ncbi:universal stress protein [Natronobiforma cellulositropha]|uniref:universal stress protein n=1 Tax=Natronobiforma cellulositropha TaxID=1679076 RepID=UPI0021D5D204|nr:universal stress protein [Natronobiforma cellulositropha]
MSPDIIIPTDGSECAEKAFDVGFGLAEKLGATVHAVAVGNVKLAEISSIGGGGPRTKEDVTEIAAEWADDLVEAAEARGLEATAVVRTGDPAAEIAAYAADLDAEMIVMGTAGRSGFKRRILGSVADEVLRTAPVPVLTVRPDGQVDAA